MPLAVLSIDLEAKLAKFDADMGRAQRSLDKLAQSTRNTFSGVGDVFAGSFLASTAEQAIRGLIQMFPTLIDGVAAFQDLSEETGASAVALASFQTSADVSGVSVKDLAGLMVKLTGNLSKLTDEGKGAGAALAALGVPLEAFRAMSPDEQIKTLAASFDRFADGSGKTAGALALFGKSGAQVLKFFNEWQNGAGESNRLTAEMIVQADAWADSHARTRSEFKQTAQVIAVTMLPSLTALTKGFEEGIREVLGMDRAVGGLDPRQILDWAETGTVAIATMGDTAVQVFKVIQAIGGTIGRFAVGAKFLVDAAVTVGGIWSPEQNLQETSRRLGVLLDARNAAVEEDNQRWLNLWNQGGASVTESIRKSFAEQRRLLDPENARELARMRQRAISTNLRKPELSLTVPDEASKKADSAFARFMAQITEKQQLAQAELDSGEKLNESDRFRLQTLLKLDEAESTLDPKRKAKIRAALDEAVAVLKLNETQAARLKLMAAETTAVATQLQTQGETNTKLQEQIAEIGLSADALDDLRIKRLQLKVAMKEEQLVALELFATAGDDLSQRQLMIAALKEELALLQQKRGRTSDIARDPTKGAADAIDAYLKKVEESGTATREVVGQSLNLLEDDLVSGLAKGRLDISRTVDYMIGEFLRLQVIRPLMRSLFGGEGVASGLAALFGFADGGAFSAGGPIAFARGGVVDSPRLFKFAQGGRLATGLMGEAGPEAVMPLKRGPGGALGVQVYGGGRGGQAPVIINQSITIGAGVSRNEVLAAMEQTKRATIAAVADAQRRGRAIA